MSNHVHLKTLEQAARLAGGEDQLARRLQVEPAQLTRWMSGDEKPPLDAFFRAADLVVDETHARLNEIFDAG